MNKANKKIKLKTLDKFTIYSIALLLTIITTLLAIAYGVNLSQTTAKNSIKQQQFANIALDSYGTYVAGTWQHYLDTINLMTKEALSADDLESKLKNNLPKVKAVKLFADVDSLKNLDQDFPLGFAGIDNIKKSFQGQKILPQAHKIAKDTVLLTVVQPVTIKDNIYQLYLAFDLSLFDNLLQSMKKVPGFLTLEQAGNFILAKSGNDKLIKQKKYSASVANTDWQLSLYLDSNNTAFSSSLSSSFYILFGIGILVLTASCYLYRQITKVKLLADLKKYSFALNAKDFNKNNTSYNFSVFKYAHEKYVKTFQENKPKSYDINPKPADKDDSLSTSIIFHGEDSLTVEEIEDNNIDKAIFRQYDIRGIADKQLTDDKVALIAKAIGTLSKDKNINDVVVGFDGRLSSNRIVKSLVSGLLSTGINVINVGLVPSPLLYFSLPHLSKKTGVMITASHNPKEYNGFKIIIDNKTLCQEEILAIYEKIKTNEFASGQGSIKEVDINNDYIDRVKRDIKILKPMKVVIDCANAVAGIILPDLLKQLNIEVIPLFCDVDGNFPNHAPDPTKKANLTALIQKVKEVGADFGLAFDGDADRLGVVDCNGDIVVADNLLILLAKDVLSRNKAATIIYDVKCSKNVETIVKDMGGEPIMAKTGHSIIKEKMLETNALLAGEMSGHIFIKERWYGFDDAIYTALRLLEIYAESYDVTNSAELFAFIPKTFTTPEIELKISPDQKFQIIEKAVKEHGITDANIITIDGLRVEYPDSWGLIRASNTSDNLIMRFEGKTKESLDSIQSKFVDLLQRVAPDLKLPSQLIQN